MRNKPVNAIFTKTTFLIGALLFAIIILSACASPTQPAVAPTSAPQATSAPQPTSAPQATTAPTAAQPPTETAQTGAPTEAVLDIATDTVLGDILVGEDGMTLYIFTKDTADTSNCDAACLMKWPPLITQGEPVLGQGVDAAMVGTATLADGSKIVTYNHMPLYYWYRDQKAGDTNGQAVGDVWFVLAPDGTPVGLTNANDNTNANANSNTNANQNSNDNSGYDDSGSGNDNSNSNPNQNSNDNSGNGNG